MTLRMAMRMGVIAAGLSAATTAFAAPPATTPAGTQIANTARLTLAGADADPLVIDSNTVTIAVDTLIDAAIVADRPSVTVTAATPLPVPFTLANPGNAAATYQLGARADRDGVTITTIVADVDGDGRYDPAVDRALGAITLAAGASQRLLVLVAGAVDGATVTATATTTATGDAVLGSSGGRATATARLVAGDGPAARLDKAQAVAAPDGSARAVSGATVTYTMTARFARDCVAVELSDAVPEGTRFVPGSIALDEQLLSDGADADAGRLEGTTIRVTLGDMPAGAVRSIRFKAIIL
jgi:uncharacterized repeat protein (TIGR01451 family)